MNQFSERYRNISNADLFRVIENQTDYQPEAIEAAKNELNQRKLTDQDLTAVKVEMKAEQQEKEEYRKKRIEVERKVKNLGASALDTITPIQRSATTPEKIIRLITIVFGLIAILKWYDQFGLASFMLSEISSGWDSSMVEYFLPLLLLPIAVVFFWLRRKIGWILMTTYLTYSAITGLGLIIMTWNMEASGIPALDDLFPQTSTTTQVLALLFYGGALWAVAKQEIKDSFNVNSQTALGTIVTASILTILLIAPYLLS